MEVVDGAASLWVGHGLWAATRMMNAESGWSPSSMQNCHVANRWEPEEIQGAHGDVAPYTYEPTYVVPCASTSCVPPGSYQWRSHEANIEKAWGQHVSTSSATKKQLGHDFA